MLFSYYRYLLLYLYLALSFYKEKLNLTFFFSFVVNMRLRLITFDMRQFYFLSAFTSPLLGFACRTAFLTHRCSGLTYKAASTAVLIR
jgi:hypothetical protein